jgi:membrane associated rhomboid family serine protease
MSYQERHYRQRLSLAQRSNALIILISINLIIFAALKFVMAIYYLRYGNGSYAEINFQNNILKWFTLPADVSQLAARPWTVVTYMFTHEGTWHLIGNMLWVWAFGYILQDLTGNRKIFPVFLYGGFAGALSIIIAYNFFPALQPHLSVQQALGASAGVMAIAAAVTTLSPGYRIFPMLNGGFPIWILTAIFLVIDLATIPQDNPGGHIAHIAGALTGFLFIFFYQRGYDWGGWMNNFYDWFTNLFNPDKPKKGRSAKQELYYKSTSRRPYHKTPNVTAQRVDEILDKINQHGYDSLTDEEKELLKKASRDY